MDTGSAPDIRRRPHQAPKGAWRKKIGCSLFEFQEAKTGPPITAMPAKLMQQDQSFMPWEPACGGFAWNGSACRRQSRPPGLRRPPAPGSATPVLLPSAIVELAHLLDGQHDLQTFVSRSPRGHGESPVAGGWKVASVFLGDLRFVSEANRHARSLSRRGIDRNGRVPGVFAQCLHDERAELARRRPLRSLGPRDWSSFGWGPEIHSLPRACRTPNADNLAGSRRRGKRARFGVQIANATRAAAK
jgi:hypothetical protein